MNRRRLAVWDFVVNALINHPEIHRVLRHNNHMQRHIQLRICESRTTESNVWRVRCGLHHEFPDVPHKVWVTPRRRGCISGSFFRFLLGSQVLQPSSAPYFLGRFSYLYRQCISKLDLQAEILLKSILWLVRFWKGVGLVEP